ncbi:MAG: cytochrome c biogenesis CcdA family protein [Myxococcales bacterium]
MPSSPRELSHPRRALLLIASGAFAVLCLLAAGIFLIPRTEVGHPGSDRKTDADRVRLDQVYVDVTYATAELIHRVKLDAFQQRWGDRAQGFLVGLNAHVGDIHACHFAGSLKLEDSSGHLYPSLGQPVVVSHHHNLWIAFFPKLDDFGRPIFDPARKFFTIHADGIGDIPQRRFRFELPIVPQTPGRGPWNRLGLFLAVIGAMLVVLSPCAVELTAYYAAIIAGVLGTNRELVALGRSSRGYADADRDERRRIVVNLLSFAGGFTLLYSFSGATVGLIGQSVGGNQEIFGPYKDVLHDVGAVLVAYFGLRVLGLFELAPVERALRATTGRLRAALHRGAAWAIRRVTGAPAPILDDSPEAGPRPRITPVPSFLLGIGLSVGCLTCMGGAVIYPLMIFAGTSRWYWGFLTLFVYSAGIALPMMLITLGVAHLRPSLGHRVAVARLVQGASGALLLIIALLLATDHERNIFDPIFHLLSKFVGPA